jgi:hypothetical protein
MASERYVAAGKMKTKWELLILTMPTRVEFLRRLLISLEPQCASNPEVSIRIRTCDPRYTLGENREMLRRSSEASYLSFVDDDDGVDPEFVSTILPLLDGIDYVGFDVQAYIDGKPLVKITHHSLRYDGWYETDEFYARDISHINPMRRDLVLLEAFEGGHGEDVRWADRMRARGVLKTERYIDRVLYHYYFRTRKNIGKPCPKCGSTSTVLVGEGTVCNACSLSFDRHPEQKSCLWT